MPIQGILDPTYRQSFTRRGATEYGGTGQQHAYQEVSGLRVLARAADGAAPKIVRIHGDYGLRTVSFESTRVDRPPIVPKGEDIRSGDVVTDVYLGGHIALPTPSPNEKSGGFNWTVTGTYQYVQTPMRRPGTTCLPTGGYPHPLYPQDTLMSMVMRDAAVGDPPAGVSAAAYVVDEVSRKTVDHNTLYTWPFTYLPAECVTSDLIGG